MTVMILRHRRLPLAALLLAAAATLFPASAQERSLSWRSLDVTARLDADGRLHVAERHAMVFTGDWNGGERRFRIDFGQRFEFDGIERVEPRTGESIPLVAGDLGAVDRWAFTDDTTLRWRSRSPTDPPFDRTELVYVLRYRLSNILVAHGSEYLLDHDFAFPDRDGPIESFSLRLDLDPAWSPRAPFDGTVARGRLPPGAGVVLTLPLAHRGAAPPAGVFRGAPQWLGWLLAAGLAGGAGFLAFLLYRRERELGRFAPLVRPKAIDPPWLDANVFSSLPEVIGAAWDRSVGGPEVSAILARLTAEGKIETEVSATGRSKPLLRLALRVERRSLSGHEAELVSGLFIDGDTTDIERVRVHYASRGFDPVDEVRQPLEKLVAELLGSGRAPSVSRRTTLALLAGSVGLTAAAGLGRSEDLLVVAGVSAAGIVAWLVAVTQAQAWRTRAWREGAHALRFLVPLGLYTSFLLEFLVRPWVPIGSLALAGLATLGLTFWSNVCNLAKAREGAVAIASRKRLVAAREFFRAELRKERPGLDDRWFPYLLALGLAGKVDRWFRDFGTARAGRSDESGRESASDSSRSSSSGSAATASWSGGGGAFGGGGASATWAAAAGTLAAGVSAPSDSGSSGGSSGGSSSSSGGGGGGGW